jgi:cysteine synthase A
MTKRFANILETIGNTPLVRINRLGPKGVNLWVKMEAFNPLGSVKDRLALAVIEAAEKSGELKPGQTVVEATSGNTGIGLAMVCARQGLPLRAHDGRAVQRRAAEADALPRREGRHHPAAQRAVGMVKKTQELRRQARLVLDAPVRERGQSRFPLAHHRAGDRLGIRR